jgi:phytoene dehydrogenase-like protein
MEPLHEKIKLKIPTPDGKYIEVEGDVEKIRTLIASLQSEKIHKAKPKGTVKQQIINLIREGFFDKPKSFPELKKELARRGYPYKTNTLFPILFREFLKDGHLQRMGEPKKYLYFVPKEEQSISLDT